MMLLRAIVDQEGVMYLENGVINHIRLGWRNLRAEQRLAHPAVYSALTHPASLSGTVYRSPRR